MSHKKDSRQTAFDFDDDGGGVSFPAVHAAERTSSSPIWQEVPQALFLSWSRARQMDYCARRDEDSAQQVELEDREFYAQRAQWYRAEVTQ